ncbi:hypothetical protein GCM10027275_25350 [Rhabdobacter roseus]|uniref:Putative small lipoprotein YifL n=1 Tax=Rhabdobacter roseus TaxID=1655419 RepID=A0A840TWB9_9BACT|nr:hypothetical protein [Rhabdobacter roseus]MBB5284478.1 putative small lipoprotein YifL [Rhabdobacter roseus]
MKVPASVLKAMAAAVIVASVTACTGEDIGPKNGKKKEEKTLASCPACGMG